MKKKSCFLFFLCLAFSHFVSINFPFVFQFSVVSVWSGIEKLSRQRNSTYTMPIEISFCCCFGMGSIFGVYVFLFRFHEKEIFYSTWQTHPKLLVFIMENRCWLYKFVLFCWFSYILPITIKSI